MTKTVARKLREKAYDAELAARRVDLGDSLTSAYEDRMAVRVERAAMMPTEALAGTPSSDAQPQGSSPELASLAGRYLSIDTLGEEDVANVKSLAASVLSQKTTD